MTAVSHSLHQFSIYVKAVVRGQRVFYSSAESGLLKLAAFGFRQDGQQTGSKSGSGQRANSLVFTGCLWESRHHTSEIECLPLLLLQLYHDKDTTIRPENQPCISCVIRWKIFSEACLVYTGKKRSEMSLLVN